jgi:hypothetical protein
MKQKILTALVIVAALAAALLAGIQPAAAQDPLTSWNDTASKNAILAFVERLTKQARPTSPRPPNASPTFDNDREARRSMRRQG